MIIRCYTFRDIQDRLNVSNHTGMVELVDTQDLKSCIRKDVRVQVPFPVLALGLKILGSLYSVVNLI